MLVLGVLQIDTLMKINVPEDSRKKKSLQSLKIQQQSQILSVIFECNLLYWHSRTPELSKFSRNKSSLTLITTSFHENKQSFVEILFILSIRPTFFFYTNDV